MPVSASIEIAAPPEAVRAKFLDFSSLPTYHKSFFGSITPINDNLNPDSKLRVVLNAAGQIMEPVIIENTPACFAWRGSIPLLFTGAHYFRFEKSQTLSGGTHFVQEEVFGGALGFLMGENVVARQIGFAEKTVKGWTGFNADFKDACEK
ncbi:hypothetical protein P3342_012692 [Pyrenophora teres f. teres]|uniref:Polyketide-cyc2 domain containing protein n=2 Tax=Pyrenophora teres f. teres TaxID=97479 RepID=E3RNY7_PYRTT|nr:hypothetical protein PTT_10316 [Pyrenophora teres f. teres 0-1]KAE8827024.1 hypothetical protein HRS9139_08196 [Pyrenophora teres f. teres]CAA9966717.1 Polyketide-cyc2 domain containing protein [Pyrenophora teres f. maculata]KAE8832541.1 hypothetical protein PTNB85_06933 [Pyrenophora teres f. teres]KAE8836850.1 hypothetical protein HRS9122_07005 [Pyrenophora teres f. teres]